MPSLREGMDRGGSARANAPDDDSRGNAFALQTLLQHSFKFPFKGKLTLPKALFREMASPAGTTNSGLVAAALIIRSRDGPRFVFHYPARPTTEVSKEKILYGTEFDEGTSDDEHESKDQSEDSDLEDGGHSVLQAVYKIDLNDKKQAKQNHVEEVEGDEHYDNSNGEHVVPWEHLFDFSTTDLESILTPSRAYHKKKFELSLDPLYFISYPMHIREDGLWKKKKIRKTKKSKIEDSEAGTGSGETKSVELDKEAESSKTPATDNNSEDGDDHGGMTMFNVVFILSVAKDEADERIAEVYEHVIKKFNKALKHAQASSNYVWKESEMILGMKEKAREERRPMSWLWNEILIKSTLAAAIRVVYKDISHNKIATVHLAITPPLDLSLQIPVPMFLTSLPTSSERSMLGLPVMSANPFVNEEGDEDPTHLNKHFALLLLGDEDKIISEIQTDNTELSAPLIECIRLCKPTLSFAQVAQTNSIEVGSLLILAQHLIYWRRAIAIPPLHGRETFIVSPNCDSRKLPAASVTWKKAFPLAPSLPSFLASLSAAPRPYKGFAPSKDHRPTYLDMVAWLLRGGWVTFLRTFAWIQVWPELIYEVEYQLKADAIEKYKKGAKSQSGSSENESTDESGTEKSNGTDIGAPLTTEQVAENARLARLAVKQAKEAAEEAATFAEMPVPVATAHPSINNSAHLKRLQPYVIKDPHKVSHEESLYIAAIGKRISDAKGKDCWTKFNKYFNGSEALESIALKENMKRKLTWEILMMFQEHLLICKHW